MQKRAASWSQSSSVDLFNKFQWFPIYKEIKIAKSVLTYKRLQASTAPYTADSLKLNNEVNSRKTRYPSINVISPKFTRMTEKR
jgi:hypothetical protein